MNGMNLRETVLWALFGSGGLLKVRAILAYATTGLIGYMYVNEIAIPESLTNGWLVIIAFYFATRAAESAAAKNHLTVVAPSKPPAVSEEQAAA